ncbi:hypothetical protein PAPYR_13016 [Paratrimastix pyriformis]|uniref:Uncharacterized protein n=1 Tax=Paratrimastix pyriformis TaxID=342808 RepID=A0ABQ8U0Z1_9EUKA|nr:hypothetical protein PAPYR_13016 [Paratrimastix pyriformis]
MVDFIAEYVLRNSSGIYRPFFSDAFFHHHWMLDGYDASKPKASQTPPAKRIPNRQHQIMPSHRLRLRLQSWSLQWLFEHRQCSPSPPPPNIPLHATMANDTVHNHRAGPLVPPPPFPYGPVIPLEAVPVQLVPVPVKTVSVVPLDSGDPGPPQLRARRRRRR